MRAVQGKVSFHSERYLHVKDWWVTSVVHQIDVRHQWGRKIMAVPSSGVELRRTVINFAPADEERHYGGLNGSHGMAVMT